MQAPNYYSRVTGGTPGKFLNCSRPFNWGRFAGPRAFDGKSNAIKAIRELPDMRAIKRTAVATPFETTPLAVGPAAIRAAARAIENNLPWPLDITFDEDRCRARNDISALNLAIVRQMVFKILKRKERKLSFARKRWKASVNQAVRLLLAC